jgi:hypothetical protein
MKKLVLGLFLLALGFVFSSTTPSFAGPSGAVLCYLVANNAGAPFNTPYTPDFASAFNTGGGISVTHTGTGTYSVTCNGLGVGGLGFQMVGNVQVTAVGSSNIYCHANSWASGLGIIIKPAVTNPLILGGGGSFLFSRFDASVVCFGPPGHGGGGGGGGGGPVLTDSEFSLVFIY